MCKVTSIETYLKWVYGCGHLEVAGTTWQQLHLFFRGQADKDWKLQPSVFVNKEDEFQLLHDAYRHAWKYLQDYPTDLEKMIVLQHYGLHTRLLDLTSNPLIALYFACVGEGQKDKDGKVFCYCAKSKNEDGRARIIAKTIAKGVSKTSGVNQFLMNEFSHIVIHPKDSPINIESFEKWKKELFIPQFFVSPFNNHRITSQRGAFIIAPLHENDSEIGFHFDQNSIESMEDWHSTKAIVASESKAKILKELEMCGIDESTVYPDLEHLLRFLNCKYQSDQRFKVVF